MLGEAEKSRITPSKAGSQTVGTWSSMLLTPSGPSRSMAWPIRSVRPQLSIRKPRSRWNLSVAALESRRLKELKQHSGLMTTTPDNRNHQTLVSAAGSCRLDICVS